MAIKIITRSSIAPRALLAVFLLGFNASALLQASTNSKTANLAEAEPEVIVQQIRIGITSRRQPYTHLTDKQQYTGLLIDSVNTICESVPFECEFMANDFHALLDDLQTFKINMFIIVDSLALPEIDKVRLSQPLCTANPVFIQKNNQPTKQEKQDFQRSTIGVLEGSLHHFYLLDEYSNLARIKPYKLLESGIVDLFFGRIDSLFMDEAVFAVRIRDTPLGHVDKPEHMASFQVGKPELSPTALRLVVRANDTELLDTLNKHLSPSPPVCLDLLETDEKPAFLDGITTEKKRLK